jgi:hypothetical protein
MQIISISISISISINIATAKPVLASGRKVLSATSKRARRRCACDANRTAGDEQADLSVPRDWRRRCIRIRWSTMRFGKRQDKM